MNLTRWRSFGASKQTLAGVGDPFGRFDTANQSAREWWDHFTKEHNENDGSHKIGGLPLFEEGVYFSASGDQIVTLLNNNLVIDFIMIVASGSAQNPVLASVNMPSGETKEFKTIAFQTNMIKDISITGQFTVGTDDRVNIQTLTIRYYYWVVGHEL